MNESETRGFKLKKKKKLFFLKRTGGNAGFWHFCIGLSVETGKLCPSFEEIIIGH